MFLSGRECHGVGRTYDVPWPSQTRLTRGFRCESENALLKTIGGGLTEHLMVSTGSSKVLRYESDEFPSALLGSDCGISAPR